MFSRNGVPKVLRALFSTGQGKQQHNSPPLVLTFNSGSSSVKFQALNPLTRSVVLSGSGERLGTEEASVTIKWAEDGSKRKTIVPWAGHDAIADIIAVEAKALPNLVGFGHRVVHGGHKYKEAQLITDHVKDSIKESALFAPLHNVNSLKGIEIMEGLFPTLHHVAVFDTAYHGTIPEFAHRYAVPNHLYTEHHLRKYGFHGTSHKYINQEVARIWDKAVLNTVAMGRNKNELRVISCHLGNGCSVTASKGGVSLDTSMGLGPLEGLMMGQRSGDVDPTLVQIMNKKLGLSLEEIMSILNTQSGFKGISGISDSRDLEEGFLRGEPNCVLAVEMFCYRVAKYISAFTVPIQGLDALVFTGGIGEKSSIKRGIIVDRIRHLGVTVDSDKNGDNALDITGGDSKAAVLVVPTNEELLIAQETWDLICKN